MSTVHRIRLSLRSIAAVALVASLQPACALCAQGHTARTTPRIVGIGLEIRPYVGTLLPTGAQREIFRNAAALGGQLGWRVNENLTLTGSLLWARSRDRTTAVSSSALFTGREERVDMCDVNFGAELGMPISVARSWTINPYFGAGGGVRSYHYRDVDRLDLDAESAGFAVLGVDLGRSASHLGFRVEVRDNMAGVVSPPGEYSEVRTRNEVQVGGGLVVRF